ncbi:SDR family oxidoreductase [Sphingomonas sp. ID0503]|uniref:SDR family oxidoreductase n=1 Tax=Sphingomonas sp. ID0503 TaxID=3399691 RepID=UPI003AFB7F65
MSALAITGGTGFLGSHLIDLAMKRGIPVRALTRRPQPAREGVTWIEGALDRPDSLRKLAEGATAVIHVAGVINAPTQAGFDAGNVAGTEAMLAAAEATGARRFVHTSSLSAREPALSMYGASKARSEDVVRASALNWTIVRPPAIYGPRDREMLELFRMARHGFVLLPPRGHLSVIAAEDLARLLLDLVPAENTTGRLYEPDDGREGGWSHHDFARALGRAVGRKVVPLSTPAALLRLTSRFEGLFRRGAAKLTADRVRYFCHPDWVATPEAHPTASLWRAEIPTPDGLAATAAWYRREGWLR